MNYRTILMASAAVLLSTQAMAADITNPFFTPAKGEFTSNTEAGYFREKGTSRANGYVDEAWTAAETLEYGITDNVSVNATIANQFDTSGEYNNDHNFMYRIGAKYNTRFNSVLFQASVDYMTYDEQDFIGGEGDGTWYKELGAELKVGYELDCGLTPYASYAISGNIDDGDRELEQSVKAAVYKNFGAYALDLGLRYDFNTDGDNTNDLWVDAAADYYVTDNVAVGLFGSYRIDGSGDKYIDYSYNAGARVKVLF